MIVPHWWTLDNQSPLSALCVCVCVRVLCCTWRKVCASVWSGETWSWSWHCWSSSVPSGHESLPRNDCTLHTKRHTVTLLRPSGLEITNLTFLFKQNMVYVFHQRKEQSENKQEKPHFYKWRQQVVELWRQLQKVGFVFFPCIQDQKGFPLCWVTPLSCKHTALPDKHTHSLSYQRILYSHNLTFCLMWMLAPVTSDPIHVNIVINTYIYSRACTVCFKLHVDAKWLRPK